MASTTRRSCSTKTTSKWLTGRTMRRIFSALWDPVSRTRSGAPTERARGRASSRISSSRSAQQEIIWFNGQVYFDVGGNISIPETGLWTTDGTVAGTTTVRIGDISNITDLRIANGRLQFWSATADPFARELWTSDGTSGGTVYLGNHSDVTNNVAVRCERGLRGAVGFPRGVRRAARFGSAGPRVEHHRWNECQHRSHPQHQYRRRSADPGNFLPLGDQMLFVGPRLRPWPAIVAYDGTESGTFQLQDIVQSR